MKRPDYGDATPEDLARALLRPINRTELSPQTPDRSRGSDQEPDPKRSQEHTEGHPGFSGDVAIR